ncbi:histidine-rich protein PFHRP-II-like [Penaeus monodon]|uniref:histidine-rich protein PFHRP-II-like n=1 Tax=Penaeus monodon TaxID=6687 RepID=UPI0018A6FB6C|nr:histidine-rich protein PFHRP-II-like [Penaeus monodon]
MKTLVVLAVLGVCSASLQQAYNHGYNYVQPRYVGPLASTVPAGVDGTITPVSDTYEVAAARGAFFRAYQDQLATVNALRYGTPATHHAVHHSAPAVQQNVASVHHSAPAVHQNVASVHHSAPAVHQNVASVHHSASAVHQNVASVHQNVAAVHHGVPAGHYSAGLGQVRDTPEVSAAKAEFFRLYNQQAAAAAAAPDHHAHHDY